MKRRGAGVPLTNSSKIPYDDYFDGDIQLIWLERVLEDSGSGVVVSLRSDRGDRPG